MANVFSDIYEAIRIIRQKKGTKETDIMTYVHDRLGKGVSIRTVLKTMKTLNRLVDDGLLIKKGCRYLLPLPCDSGQEKKEDNADDCMEEDEDDDEDNNDEGEDEDDDEGDEDEDEDDDDDDGECNMDEDDIEGKDEGSGDRRDKKDPCDMDDDGMEARGRRNEDAELTYKHIDSKMKKYMKSELNPVAGSFIRSKKQRQGARRNQVYDGEYDDMSQARSPAAKTSDEIDLMMDVEEGLHESEGGAQFNNSDLSFEYEEGDRPEGYNVYRYKSPNGPPPPNTPGVHVERRESCCSDLVLKVDDLAEAESEVQGDGKAKRPEEGDEKQVKDRQSKRRARDGSEDVCRKEKARRDVSAEKPKDDKQYSICELCKKKKRPGYGIDCAHNSGNW